jgi:hypothetical protein
VAVGICKAPHSVAPKHVSHGHLRFTPGIERALERLVHIFYIEVKSAGGPTQGLRRLAAPSRVFVIEENDGIADLQLGVANLAVGTSHPHEFLGAQRLLVVLDCLHGISNRQRGCNCVESFWTWFSSFHEILLGFDSQSGNYKKQSGLYAWGDLRRY